MNNNHKVCASQKILNLKGVKFIKEFASIDEYKLDNGLKIILKPNPNVPLLSFQVWYKVGSRNEDQNYTGLAHYLEHIMFKGTKQFRKGDIAQSINLRGGIFNAFTSDDYTAYYENFAPEHLELALRIESDRMQNSRIDPEEVELERSVIVSELEGNRNSPQNILYENLRSSAYSVHSYRNPVIGWKDDLKNINSKVMQDFYKKYYYPDNARIVLVGNFDTKLALTLIQKYFGQYKSRNSYPSIVGQEPEQKSLKKITLYSQGNTKLLGIAFHIPSFTDKASPALHLASDILFGDMTSRLYPKLVDSGLCNNISATAESNIDPSIFRILVNVNLDTDIEVVEKIIDEELDSIKQNISKEELNLAKAREESSFVYQADGVYEEGLQLGYFDIISGDWTNYIHWLDQIKNISEEDIKEAAKKYFVPSNKTVAYLLPQEAGTNLSLSQELPKKILAYYGANQVEPLNPNRLKHLIKLSEAKYSKNHKFPQLNLDFKNLSESNWSIYFREDHNLPLIFMNVLFYAGSASDNHKPGLAYLTAQLLARGSEQKDKYEISKLNDIYGSDIDFSSTKENAKIHLSTISKNFTQVIDLLNEILKTPKFDPEELNKLKLQLIAQIQQEEDYPQKISRSEITRIIYPKGHPYYIYSAADKIASIKSISVEDIKNFYHQNYNSNNLKISVVGDLEEVQLKDNLHKLFDDWNIQNSSGNKKPQIESIDIKDPETKTIIMKDKEQVEITLGHALSVNRKSPDFYPLFLANQILGGSALSSKLGAIVRDEYGYAYNVRSNFNAGLGSDIFQVSLGTNPKNVTNAINLSKKVIEDLIRTGVNDTELRVSKSYLIDSFGPRNLGSNEDIAESFSQIQIYELGDSYIKNYKKEIEQISIKEVNDALTRLIKPDKLNAVIVGPEFK